MRAGHEHPTEGRGNLSGQQELPPTQARFATLKVATGMACARARCRRPSHNRRTLELCPYAAAGRRYSVLAEPCR
jgi:hypothetical protein